MTEVWGHFNPVRICAGRGAVGQLGAYTKGKSVWLIVTTRGASRRGTVDLVRNQFSLNQELLVYDDIKPNPELDDLDRITAAYRKENIGGIIGLGGGSALDAAKVLSVTLLSDSVRPLDEHLRGSHYVWPSSLPLIAIPTTAGTGSEVTPFATVWDHKNRKKYSVSGTAVFPALAILDPSLTLTLPKSETLYTALDATSHALESIWNKNRTPFTEALAWHALEMLAQSLPVVLENLDDLRAREKMQQASAMAGMAISQTRTAIAHSISYPLTIHYGVPHGLACSFTLPTIIDFYMASMADPRRQFILKSISRVLRDIDMPSLLRTYIDGESALELEPQMSTPDRAGNFTLAMSIREILSKSLREG